MNLEFKSTLRWDIAQRNVNHELPFSVLKTIAAFLNSSGGTLVIGVEDNGNVLGLEYDIKILGKDQSRDGFQQLLMNLIAEYIGAQYAPFIKVRFEELEKQYVCVIDVDKAPQPVYLTRPNRQDFFVRVGNTTRSLSPQELTEYIGMSWGA